MCVCHNLGAIQLIQHEIENTTKITNLVPRVEYSNIKINIFRALKEAAAVINESPSALQVNNNHDDNDDNDDNDDDDDDDDDDTNDYNYKTSLTRQGGH